MTLKMERRNNEPRKAADSRSWEQSSVYSQKKIIDLIPIVAKS